MTQPALSASHISKMYRLGTVGTGTLKDDLTRLWARVRGHEDPFAKIGEANDRTAKGNSPYVWALKDVTFDVKPGEVLGIVGRNGAGKSTLLKILSRVTTPTSGEITMRGRVASLLEVGTGFHPELTGRENVYLNGAILGMRRHEIQRKFDEIVAFAGVERYIDTPVKRYSSGMYVRLAFAVAAHLEPEILIVDEVLAVGDAEFQKKCLGKMKDVSVNEGRTVLFVSHNMAAVKSLCTSALLMRNGQIDTVGSTESVVNRYIKLNSESLSQSIFYEDLNAAPGNENIRVKSIRVKPEEITVDSEIEIDFTFQNRTGEPNISLCFDLVNIHEQTVFSTAILTPCTPGEMATVRCRIPSNLLNDDIYSATLYFSTEGMRPLYQKPEIIQFEVRDNDRDYAYFGKINGVIRPKLKWQILSSGNR